MSFSILNSIAEKLTFCKKCSMVCCVKVGNTEDSISVDSHIRHSHNARHSNNSRFIHRKLERSQTLLSDVDELFNNDQKYDILENPITAEFYEEEDLGKFMTDIDGYCLYINEKGAEHIGEIQSNLHYGIFWLQNLFNEDFKKVSDIWRNSLTNEVALIYTERRIVDNHIRYLIVEAYPVFSGTRCKGLKGIILRTTKPIWKRFTQYLQRRV